MRRACAVAVLVVGSIGSAGCHQLAGWQQAQYETIKAVGLPELEPKSPGIAATANLLLGFGDSYNEEWGAFVINLLLWPASIVWGVPEAAITASNLNKQETWAYYYVGLGKPQLDAALAKQKGAAPTQPAGQ